MSLVNVSNVRLLNNPGKFEDPIEFEITYESLEDLAEDLQWKVTYVASARSSDQDQVLDDILVGPVQRGVSQFVFQVPPPDISKILADEVIGMTVMMLSVLYKNQEFARIGYFVCNEYDNEEMKESPPNPPRRDRIIRNVLEKPRVLFWAIRWDGDDEKGDFALPEEVEAQAAREDAEGEDLVEFDADAAGQDEEADDEEGDDEQEIDLEEHDTPAGPSMDVSE
eukprot:TRINITY_DN23418_c0_g1_i1.p1 TRINITY_DN23418_c0_g1~~TRINITY_DN23418_c0_g1_i1.p1  ORF type:complete len:237 (+),score=77.74 TRINITY_DN23418_c0_g1_i1:40-711(+)